MAKRRVTKRGARECVQVCDRVDLTQAQHQALRYESAWFAAEFVSKNKLNNAKGMDMELARQLEVRECDGNSELEGSYSGDTSANCATPGIVCVRERIYVLS